MEPEDPCSCTTQDQTVYWEALKNQFEDQSLLLKAKELELREKIAQVESLIAGQSTTSCSYEEIEEVPKIFPKRPASPEKDVTVGNGSNFPATNSPGGFFHKVMENAKSILTMKCSAIHPSNTTSEEPTRETDSSSRCNTESRSTSSKIVSFETVPETLGSSSECCICDKDSTTKNDTTADSYSQEMNNSFCCSDSCSFDAGHAKESNICSCCLSSNTRTSSKQASRVVFSHTTSTYNVPKQPASCNTSRIKTAPKEDKIIEAMMDTSNRDIKAIASPCQICCDVKSQVHQQIEAMLPFDTRPPRKTSACQVCIELKKPKLTDKQSAAQASISTKSTKVSKSSCCICLEKGSQLGYNPSDKQVEAQAITSSRAVSGQSLHPADKQIEAVVTSSSKATRITRSTCRVCLDKKNEVEAKEREKPLHANLDNCWVNPLSSKKPKARDTTPSQDAAPLTMGSQNAGDVVPCNLNTCPEKTSSISTRSCTPNTCPEFAVGDVEVAPCREDTCPDFRNESSRRIPCLDTCPDFSSGSSRELPCREDTCPDFVGSSFNQLPCREDTCPDFVGAKRGPCRDDTCPVVLSMSSPLTQTESYGKRTEKRKSMCNIGTCPSAKRVRSRSNIRDMDNQCAFIGSPVINSSIFKGVGDTKSTTIDCCCCTAKKKPPPDTTTTEKCIKCHMQELLEREKNYDSVFKTFQNMASQPTYCCAAAAEKNHPQGDVKRITDELRLENQILKSELMELKYEMKQCLEKVEGPMKQKLQTERCKYAQLQQELNKTSENMAASQDSYMREMNALKLQLCVACSNMTDLNAINNRLKEEMKSLDCMCSKLEDDLLKQKLNEAETIRMLAKRSPGFGESSKTSATCTPRQSPKPQENQSETFKCDSNLHVIARKLSKTLKEIAPCEECSKLPELTGAAKLIKDLTDLVESRKIHMRSLESIPSKKDCSCQSPPQTENEWCQCNNFRDVGAGGSPGEGGAAKEKGDDSKPTETIFSVPPTFAEKNESSHLNIKPTATSSGGSPVLGEGQESRYYTALDQPCPFVCDEKGPCASINRPCAIYKAGMLPDEASKVPGTKTKATGTMPCPNICGDSAPCIVIGKPCATPKDEVAKYTGDDTYPIENTAPCATIGVPCARPKGKIESVLPAGKVTKDTGSEPCPLICEDTAPCVTIGKPCVLSKMKMEVEQPPVKMTKDTASEPCPQICEDNAPCADIDKPCEPFKENIHLEQPPVKITKDTASEPCPQICEDNAPCVDIGKPCGPSKEKVHLEQPPVKVTKDTASEPCPQICEDDAPCVDIGKPCGPSKEKVHLEQPPVKVTKDTASEPCPQICKDNTPLAEIGPSKEKTHPEQPPVKLTTDTGSEPCPLLCEDPAPCTVIGKPCAISDTPDDTIMEKKEEEPSPSDVTAVAEPDGDTTLEPKQFIASEEPSADQKSAEETLSCGMVCGDTAPCFSFGKPCQTPVKAVEGKVLEDEKITSPAELLEGTKKESTASPEEAAKYITGILMNTISPGSLKDELVAATGSEDLAKAREKEVVPSEAAKDSEEPTVDKPQAEEAEASDIVQEDLAKSEKTVEENLSEASRHDTDNTKETVTSEEPVEEVSETPIQGGDKPTEQKHNQILLASDKGSSADPEEEVVLQAVVLDVLETPTKDETITSEDKEEKPDLKPENIFEETFVGDFPFEVETGAICLDEPPSGLHVTTTVTTSGNLEVITEGPAGLIETALTYQEDGTIEVVTQITELSGDTEGTATMDEIGKTEIGTTEDIPVVIIEGERVKKRSGKEPITPSPEAVAEFSEAKQKMIKLMKEKDSILTGDSELTGLESVSDYTKDTTALSSSCTCKPQNNVSSTQQISQVPTFTKSSAAEVLNQTSTTTDDQPRIESEVVSRTTTGSIPISSHVVVSENGAAKPAEKTEMTVRTSPIDTKDVGTDLRKTETTRQQTSIIETVVRSTEAEPRVSEVATQDKSDSRHGEDVSSGKELHVEKKSVVFSEQQPGRGEPVSQQDEPETKTPDDRPKSVKKAAPRQKRDCACQSSTSAEQSCQCCDCKDVGVSTSKDIETNTETKMTVQKLPVKKAMEEGEPANPSTDIFASGEAAQSSGVSDVAEASALDSGKTQGTTDELSILNEESLDSKHSNNQDRSNAQKEQIVESESSRKTNREDAIELSQTTPTRRETSSEPSESYKSAREPLPTNADRDPIEGKHSVGSKTEVEKNKSKRPEKTEKKPEKRKSSSEVPDSVSKLSDRDNPPPISSSSGGKRQKKKRSSKLDYSACDCVGVCQCVVCSPEIMAKRKAATGTVKPPDPESEKLCCCVFPSQKNQAIYMQSGHQPGCPCCSPFKTEAFLRSTNLDTNRGAVPKNRKRISIEDVFLPATNCPLELYEEPPKKFPHPRSCECIDCLCLPKIQQLAQTREFPVIRDEKQIYQVSMKCECINAINAKKLAMERSRIPIATNSNASPPKIKLPTPTECTCEECKCSPCGDQAKKKIPETPGVTASKLAPGVTPSQLAKMCSCGECECKVCFNKPKPVPADEVPSQLPCDQLKGAKSATPAPSSNKVRVKGCCCKGECTCESCPVDQGDKAKDPVSAQQSKMSKKESEKLVKALSLSRPEDCDCTECVCPMSKGQTDRAPQETPASPGEEPHPDDCDCDKCVCPKSSSKMSKSPSKVPTNISNLPVTASNVPTTASNIPTTASNMPTTASNIPTTASKVPTIASQLPAAASKVSKIESKSQPPPGKKPSDCDCVTCLCPEPSSAQGDQPEEECTCEKCDCPGAATLKPTEQKPISAKPSEQKPTPLQPIPEHRPLAECDCEVCECSPCQDPKKKKTPATVAKSAPVPCDCPVCECQPCADPTKNKPFVVAKQSAICSDKPLKEKSSVQAPSHPKGCTCDICECPGKDKALGKGDEKPTEPLPTGESKTQPLTTSDEKHPDECICQECLCSDGLPTPEPTKVGHPDNCTCTECQCLDEVMETASDFSQAVSAKPSVGTKTDSGTHAQECICAECKCPEEVDAVQAAVEETVVNQPVSDQTDGPTEPTGHVEGCSCSVCQCVDCYGKIDRISHALECKCGDCICVECPKVKPRGDAMRGVPSKASKFGVPQAISFVEKVEQMEKVTKKKCICDDPTICGVCYWSIKPKYDYDECKCGVCLCEKCSYIETEPATAPDPEPKSEKPVATPETVTSETPPTLAVLAPCHCIECNCDVCSREKPKQELKHPDTCTCLACICIDCFDKAKAGAGNKTGVPAAASFPGPAGEHNPNCKCATCICLNCGKEEIPTVPNGNTQICNCGDCECVVCGFLQKPQPNEVPPEQVLGVPQPNAAEQKLMDPPPFETPIRKLCDCSTCSCVICSERRATESEEQPAINNSIHDRSKVSAPATAEAPPFEVPFRAPCICQICTCPSCNKEGGQPPISQDELMLVQGGTVQPQSTPSMAVSQKEYVSARPSSAPDSARPVSRLHCECPTCSCAAKAQDFQAGIFSPLADKQSRMSAKQSTEVRRVSCPTSHASGQPSHVSCHPSCPGSHVSCPPAVSGQPSHISGQPSHISGKPSHISGQPSHISGKVSHVSGQPSHISGKASHVSGQPSHISGKQSNISGRPQVSAQTSKQIQPQVSAQTSRISGKQSQPNRSLPVAHCECPSCQCPNTHFSAPPIPPKSSQVSCRPSHVSGKQSAQISFAPSVSSQKESTLIAVQPSHISGQQSAQMATQSSHISGQQSNHMPAQRSHISGQQSTQIAAQPSHVSGQQSVQMSTQQSHISGQQSVQMPAQQSHISGQQSTQIAAQPSHVSGQQGSQMPAQRSHISGQMAAQASHVSQKQSNVISGQIGDVPQMQVPECDCPTCVCAPCPDQVVQAKVSKLQQQTEVDSEQHSTNCTCPTCCACEAKLADIDLSQMNDEALEKKIEKDQKENCECREQIEEIRKALTKIKCACTEAELKALKSKPLVKQASAFGQTMSGLKLALTNLQEKCKAKDRMIDAMTGELKQRTSSKTFDKVLNKSISDAPDYDKADDVKSLDRSHEVISTNVLYTVEEEVPVKSHFDDKMSRAIETEKKKKKSSKTCKCGKSHRTKDPPHVDLSGFEIVDIRRITKDSIIIKWKPPRGNSITGYDIFINGVNKSKVMSGGRTSAMIHSLDLTSTIQVTIYAVTKCGRCEPPAIAIYEIRP
nr:uncharacterized protein LOC111504927 isoform X1 [Leptinotarsa decemlineata]